MAVNKIKNTVMAPAANIQTLLMLANVPAVKIMLGNVSTPMDTVEMKIPQISKKLALIGSANDKSEAKSCFIHEGFLSKALSIESGTR